MVNRRRGNRPVECEDLTERDREILRLVSHGFTTRQIAHELGINLNTLGNILRTGHPSSLFDKIGVHNRGQAASWYTQHCRVMHETHILSYFRTILTVGFICIILFTFIPLLLTENEEGFLDVYSNIYALIPALGGGYALWRYYQLANRIGPFKKFFLWFGIGLILWAIGQIIWVLLVMIYGDNTPYPSLADVAYFSGNVSLAYSIYLLRRDLVFDSNQRVYGEIAITVTLIFVSILCILWVREWRINLEDDPLKFFLDIAYPIIDAVAIGMLVSTFRSESFQNLSDHIQWVVYTLILGMSVLYIADILFPVTNLLPENHRFVYRNGGWSDRIFVLAFTLLGFGASGIPRWYSGRNT